MRIRRPRRLIGVAAGGLAALGIAGIAAVNAIDPAAYRDTLERRASAAAGRAVNVDGAIDLAPGLQPRLILRDVRVANADWAATDALLRAQRVAVDVALLPLLWGDVQLRRVALDAPRLNLATGPDGARNWTPGGARGDPAAGAAAMLRGFDRLRVRDARLAYRPRPDAPARTVHVARLAAEPGETDRLRVRGELAYRDTALRLRGQVGAPAQLLRADHHYPLALTLTALGTQARVEGTVIAPAAARRLDLRMTLNSDDPGRLLRHAGLPNAGAERLSLSAKVKGTPARFALREISGHLGRNALTGRAVLNRRKAPAELTATLNAKVLDLHPYLDRTGADAAGTARVFPDTPLPWGALHRARVDLKLTAETVKLADTLAASDAAARLTLANGKLQVRDLTAHVAGGRIGAQLTADAGAEPPAVSVTLDGDGLAYGKMLARLGITAGVAGTARVDASLRGAGHTPHALAASAAGRIAVVGGEGRIDNALLDAAGTGLADLLAPWRANDSDVRLTCAVARLRAQAGQLDSRVLLADTPSATLGADGAIDLGRERYDLRLVPKAKQTSLMSLAVPVRVTGPLRQPRIAPDPMGAAKAGAIAIGSLVNPLVTLGALVVDSRTTEGNPCVKAVEKARRKAGQADGDAGNGGGFFDELSRSIDDALGGKKASDDDDNDDALLHGGGKQHRR